MESLSSASSHLKAAQREALLFPHRSESVLPPSMAVTSKLKGSVWRKWKQSELALCKTGGGSAASAQGSRTIRKEINVLLVLGELTRL